MVVEKSEKKGIKHQLFRRLNVLLLARGTTHNNWRRQNQATDDEHENLKGHWNSENSLPKTKQCIKQEENFVINKEKRAEIYYEM